MTPDMVFSTRVRTYGIEALLIWVGVQMQFHG